MKIVRYDERFTSVMAHQTIIDLPNGSPSDIVGKDMLHIAFSIRTLHRDLTHVRDIEQSHMLTNGDMLWSNTSILIEQGHVEATKGYHRSTQREVLVVETSTFLFLFKFLFNCHRLIDFFIFTILLFH